MPIPTMTLKTAQWQPTQFTPIQYNPQQKDFSILERSLAHLEARQKEASEKKAGIDMALGQIEAKLHNDEETNKWFQTKKDAINNQIQEEIDAGDYGKATRLAISLAGYLAKDSGIAGRIEANTEYNRILGEQQKRLAAGQIDQDTFDWWNANNGYSYNAAFDDNGNEIRGTLGTITRPENKLDLGALWETAAKRVEEKSGSLAGMDSNQNMQVSLAQQLAGTPTGTSTSFNDSWHVKEEARIRQEFNELLQSREVQNQLNQEYEVNKFRYSKIKESYDATLNDPNATEEQKADVTKQLNSFAPFVSRNGSPISTYEQWYEDKITNSTTPKNLSYNRTTSDNKTINDFGASSGSGAGGAYAPTSPTDGDYSMVPGANVETKVDNSFIAQTSQAAASISEFFADAYTGDYQQTLSSLQLSPAARLNNYTQELSKSFGNYGIGFNNSNSFYGRTQSKVGK